MSTRPRHRALNDKPLKDGALVYYVQRDQRIEDNWALLTAQAIAEKGNKNLMVAFSLSPTFAGGTLRQYDFMLRGLQEMEASLKQKGIPFYLLTGSPEQTLPAFVKDQRIGGAICDFNPILPVIKWKESWAKELDVALIEVDAHNVVPCWLASPKREVGAYTIRPKLQKLHAEFLGLFPELKSQKWKGGWPDNDWSGSEKTLACDRSVEPVDWIVPGEKAAHKALDAFVEGSLHGYAKDRNLPDKPLAQSQLSPYFHFGQLAPQRAALAVLASDAPIADKDAFLDELLIRRELTDNFCFYTPDYRSLTSAPEWAQVSLDEHLGDERDLLYSLEELESAHTADDLWNAAQNEMVKRGKMHGYLRMYWAKKILEWSPTPDDALKRAIYLNDKYFLDGRDANGYANLLWSIAGLHDRPWFERPIFGKIRYMNRNGAAKKFDIKNYANWVDTL